MSDKLTSEVYIELPTPMPPLHDAVALPKEVEEGNVEYKYTLFNISNDQFIHRTTQMNWYGVDYDC